SKLYSAADYNTVKDDKFGLVYVRIARSAELFTYTDSNGQKITIKNMDVYDRLPEASNKTEGMSAPGQLVYRDPNGAEKILFDCCADGLCKTPKAHPQNYACLPMDPAVSFDGKEVVFSVLYRPYSAFKIWPYPESSQIKNLLKGRQGYAKIIRMDIASGQVLSDWGAQEEVFDMGPVFLPLKAGESESTRKVLFTSTRAQDSGSIMPNVAVAHNGEHSLQTWIANKDGTGAYRTGHHDFDAALHPFVHSNGNVYFSSLVQNHYFPFQHGNGSPQGATTTDNLLWIMSMDQTGGTLASIFGAHIGHHSDRVEDLSFYYPENPRAIGVPWEDYINSYKALHFLGETSGGWLCTTSYYRGNNLGGGKIHCWAPEAEGVEGAYVPEAPEPGNIFRPRKFINFSTWATSADTPSRQDASGNYMGKVRDPEGLTGNHLMLTYMKGLCFSALNPVLSDPKYQAVPVGCDAGIYRSTVVPSRSPKDLVAIVDRPEFHEFMGRVVMPYSWRYGKTQPTPMVVADKRDSLGRCILASSSMQTETQPHQGYKKAFDPEPCGVQGCKLVNVSMDEVKAIRFWKIDANRKHYSLINDDDIRSPNALTGNAMTLLGDVALRADGSMAAELPCDTPYVMAGVDAEGRSVLRDSFPQSLRQGEVRTCGGCHLHSRSGPDIHQSIAFQDLNNVPVLGKGVLPLMKGGAIVNASAAPKRYDFKTDVFPILQTRCASCHGASKAEAGLRLDIAGYKLDSTYGRLVWDARQLYVDPAFKFKHPVYADGHPYQTIIARPYTSKYMHEAFARQSLFYWKAAGKRTDGMTDAQASDDIDFGPAHVVPGITAEELRTISNWIDNGAY
ncbi:MAG TPA: hypothetical protein PLQ67_06275, partial [Burkholderiaceae bacterium]|nr:hypothetical protein [Burkholderiaceae bacterium]